MRGWILPLAGLDFATIVELDNHLYDAAAPLHSGTRDPEVHTMSLARRTLTVLSTLTAVAVTLPLRRPVVLPLRSTDWPT